MLVLVSHNAYQQTSGEDLVFQKDVQILKDRGTRLIEYTRSNKEIASFNALQKAAVFPRTVYSTQTTDGISRIVAHERPDVALVQNVFPLLSPSLYRALHGFGIPVVQLVYNYRFMCANGVLFTRGRICERCVHGNFLNAVVNKCYKESRVLSGLYAGTIALHRRLGTFKQISAFVTPDRFLAGKLREAGFDGGRIFSISNPFDATEYQPVYGHAGYFVYLGRLVREKGIFTLLEAMRTRPDSRLMVIGDGPAGQEAREFVRRHALDTVAFTGPRYGKELLQIMAGARAMILPSEWYDNSPLVVHQAYALGKPVVASDIDGIPEIVMHGQTGLLFEPGNAQALASCMGDIEADEDRRTALGRAARQHAESQFTAARRAEALTDVLKFAVANRV